MSKRSIFFFALIACLLASCRGDEVRYAQLPLVELGVPGGAAGVTREAWTADCALRLTAPDGRVLYASPDVSVKLRGHSTADKPKRPYTLKLSAKTSLLGLSPHKRYVLLAGFFDHSLLRNALAFEVSRQTSLAPTTPEGRFVHLEADGEYQGIYYLCEAAKDMTRDILLELDAYAVEEDDYTFRTARHQLPVSVKRPDNPTPSRLAAIRRAVDRAEEYLDTAYIDYTTFADYWIVQELCMNAEPNGPRSCYHTLTADGRLVAGPVWDFDLAFNPVGVDAGGDLRPTRFMGRRDARWLTADSLYCTRALWYDKLLADTAFTAHVQHRWALLRPRFERLTTVIDSLDALIAPVAEHDQTMWNTLEPARFDSCRTYASAVSTLRNTYVQRIEALDNLIGNLR